MLISDQFVWRLMQRDLFSWAQTFARLSEGAGLAGASRHSGRRTFWANRANKCTANRVYEVLTYMRSLSLNMIRRLSEGLQTPAEVLIRETDRVTAW